MLYSVSKLKRTLASYDGWLPQFIHRLHLKHGPVVRVAPNELSYTDPRALHDILDQKHGFSKTCAAEQAFIYGSGSEPDPAKLRAALATAFTEEAVAAESEVAGSGISKMIAGLERSSAKTASSVVNNAAQEDIGIDLNTQ